MRESVTRIDEAIVQADPAEVETGVTSDPTHPEEEGQAYTPPIDPPVIADGDGPRIAAGFGEDAEAEPYDADHHRALDQVDDEMTARVRELLAADSIGSEYVDQLSIATIGSIVILEGVVEDLATQDYVLALVASIDGVTDVRDRLRLS